MSDRDNFVYLMLVGFGSVLDGRSIFIDAFAELEYAGRMSGKELKAARELIDEKMGDGDVSIVTGITWRARFNPQYTPIMIRSQSLLSRDMMTTLLQYKMNEGTEVLREFIESAKVKL